MIYVLHSKPRVRAYAIAAGSSVLGCAVLALGTTFAWPTFVAVLGGLALLSGLILLALAAQARHADRVEIELTDAGYAIKGPGRAVHGTWDQVTRVTGGDSGTTLTLHHGPDSRTRLVAPARNPEFERLARDMARHLDRDRGYGS